MPRNQRYQELKAAAERAIKGGLFSAAGMLYQEAAKVPGISGVVAKKALAIAQELQAKHDAEVARIRTEHNKKLTKAEALWVRMDLESISACVTSLLAPENFADIAHVNVSRIHEVAKVLRNIQARAAGVSDPEGEEQRDEARLAIWTLGVQ